MAKCEGLALVTFAKNENWQDGQGGTSKGCDIILVFYSSLSVDCGSFYSWWLPRELCCLGEILY